MNVVKCKWCGDEYVQGGLNGELLRRSFDNHVRLCEKKPNFEDECRTILADDFTEGQSAAILKLVRLITERTNDL